WNMVFGQPLPVVKQKVEALKRHCDGLKRDVTKIDKSMFIMTCVAESDEEVKRREAQVAEALGTDLLFQMGRASGTIGTEEQVRESLRSYRELGFDYFIAMFPYKQDREMLQRFAETIVPLLR